MPYRKSFRRGRRTTKRRNGGQWFGSKTHQLARKAFSTAKWLSTIINTEYFNHDLALTLAPNNAAGTVSRLSAIAESDDNTGRTGRSIRAKSLYLRGTAEMNAAATITSCRMILVIDTQYIGAMPVIGSLLDTSTGIIVNCPLNIETQSGRRFKVLWDKVFSFSNSGTKLVHFKYYKKMGHHIKFGGTGATDAEGLQGQLILICVSTESTNTPNIVLNSRLRYIDN